MKISNKKQLIAILQRDELPTKIKIKADDWDREAFFKITGMPIWCALEQGKTGADAFKKFWEWEKNSKKW